MLNRDIPICFQEVGSDQFLIVSTQIGNKSHPRTEVLVYCTSVTSVQEVQILTPWLNHIAGSGSWNFALEDCDRILRITAADVHPRRAIQLLQQHGFECRELED